MPLRGFPLSKSSSSSQIARLSSDGRELREGKQGGISGYEVMHDSSVSKQQRATCSTSYSCREVGTTILKEQ